MAFGLKRRDFLKIAGVGGAGLFLGCSKKSPGKLVPFVEQPEDIIPGIPTYYASSCRGCSAGCGLIVKTREGRAIKLEGNPAHPVNRGGLCARGQASLQDLYNPDRLHTPMQKNGTGWKAVTWDEALATLSQKARAAGARTAVLTGHETGAVDRLIGEWLGALGSTHHLRHEAFGYEPLREATRLAFGRNAIPTYDFSKARLVVSLGADFLETWLSPVSAARGMAEARSGKADGQRFVAFDPRLNITAGTADKWISIRPGSEMAVALGLLNVIVSEGLGNAPGAAAASAAYDPAAVERQTGVKADELRGVAREIARARPSLVVAGGVAVQGTNATGVCLAVHLINAAVGNVGQTLNLDAAMRAENLASSRDVQEFFGKAAAKEVDLLVVYGANPAFNLPGAAKVADAMAAVPFKVALARQMDETAELCDLVLPVSHWLEAWDDAEPVDGVRNLNQPAMRTVFGSLSAGEVFFKTGKTIGVPLRQADFLGYLQDTWRPQNPGAGFDDFWNRTVQDGGTWAPPAATARSASASAAGFKFEAPKLSGADGDPVLMLIPSAHFHDGRGANKTWLQEIPDPVVKVMWDSWIEVSPATAKRLGVEREDIVELDGLAEKLQAPVFVHLGLRDDVVGVVLGQGHTSYGRYAKDRGVNPFRAMNAVVDEASGAPAYLQAHARLARTGRTTRLPWASGGTDQEGRGIAQTITVAELLNPAPRKPFGDAEQQPYVPKYKQEYAKRPLSTNPIMTSHRWGMAIDLDRCTGCSACVAACYAENNIQSVGHNETWKRRDMGWIRIEKYYETLPAGGLEVRHVPVNCQQCDNAPCEYVCPVYATYHNPEGLNAQIYNRCIGTRYCSNNCPYRARKFNYQESAFPEPLNWQLNPDVSVRSKGVMEKCTFCVQRIRAARDTAQDEDRDIRDGDITPACAQGCPTQAIVFGDQNNPESRISRIALDPRGYKIMEVLNTQPNVNYLKRVRREAKV